MSVLLLEAKKIKESNFYALAFYTLLSLDQVYFSRLLAKFDFLLCSRIANLKRSNIPLYDEETNLFLKEAIRNLQKHFVISSADKASNNIIFVCKKFYVQVICKELGISNVNGVLSIQGNAVYHPVSADISNLISNHERYANSLGLECDVDNRILPNFFAIPKLHKNPYKFRFIAGARFCSTKKLSCFLHRILQHFRSHLKNYCQVVKLRSGKNLFWSINSSLQLQQLIEKANLRREVTEIFAGDFSTMFTSLEHNIIISSLDKLIDFLFANASKRFICISPYNTFYSHTVCKNSKTLSLESEQCKTLVRFIVHNTFVQFAGLVFQQVIGIPMGGNASPLLADLTLAFLEFDFLRSSSSSLKYTLVGRYVDDMVCLNSHGFEDVIKGLYPSSLPIEKTSDCLKASFLDSALLVENGKIVSSVYNKTDAFSFSVIHYSSASSNVHSAIGPRVFYSELIRFARISNNKTMFENKIRHLFQLFIGLGHDKFILIRTLVRWFYAQPSLVCKFGIYKLSEFVNICL